MKWKMISWVLFSTMIGNRMFKEFIYNDIYHFPSWFDRNKLDQTLIIICNQSLLIKPWDNHSLYFKVIQTLILISSMGKYELIYHHPPTNHTCYYNLFCIYCKENTPIIIMNNVKKLSYISKLY